MTALGAHSYQLFKNLPSLGVREKILVETSQDMYVYVVQDKAIYDHAKDGWAVVVYAGKDPYSFNLITCYLIGILNTSDRFIVTATLQK